ncbi:MAG: LptF/LptG family permease [candidate division WOR-3 bacterium]
MTRLIDRYFIKEFIPPFLFSIFALTFILLMDQLFRLIDLFVRKGLSILIVGQILIYNLPLIVSYTIPMAILIAIVMTFGRFSHDNEILALKTGGISFLRTMRTPTIIVLLISIILIFFNHYLLPEANHRARNLMYDVARKRPAVRLPDGVFTNEFPGYTIYIAKKIEKTGEISDITIYDLKNNVIITAPRGNLYSIEDEDIMQFVLYNGELHQLVDNTKYQKTKFEKQVINIPMSSEFVRKERKARSDDELNLTELIKNINGVSSEIGRIKKEIYEVGITAIEKYKRGEIEKTQVIRFQIEQKLSVINSKIRNRARYLIELNKKFSLAFACFIFLIMGAPLGYLFRKGGIAGLLLGILLFSGYYILFLTGEEFADRRNFPPFWAMWLPNIILLIPGLILLLLAEYESLPFFAGRKYEKNL